MRAVFLLLLLMPTTAFADPVQPPPAQPIPAYVSNCNAWRPAETSAIRASDILNIRITPDGAIHDPVLVTKSGNDQLDAAAVECATHLNDQVKLMDDQTGDISWQIAIYWYDNGYSSFGPPFLLNDPNACYYPRKAMRARITGESKVTYVIESDGSTSDVKIVKSSGWKELDDAAVSCATTRHYAPLTAGGKPARAQWNANFDWRIGG